MRCRCDFGLWTLDFGLWTLDFGLWTLDFGLSTAAVRLEGASSSADESIAIDPDNGGRSLPGRESESVCSLPGQQLHRPFSPVAAVDRNAGGIGPALHPRKQTLARRRH